MGITFLGAVAYILINLIVDLAQAWVDPRVALFWRWRATVCSLITSAAAISRLLCPAATRRSASSSRAVSP